MTATPVFARHVVDYVRAGWPCIIPVPAADKYPPPIGFTGENGRDTDPAQLSAWGIQLPSHSIALRMPEGVIGIDVDHYDKGTVSKRGDDTLTELTERWGPLPPTWSSTARGGDAGPGPSRILFYRVPPQRYATKLGADIDVIQRHHRYAVVWPSPHPSTGGTYHWYDPSGAVATLPPGPGDLPELPQSWVDGLIAGATEAGPAAADPASGWALLNQITADDRPPCAEIANAGLTADAELAKADEGSRHDTMTARVHHVVQLAASGHPGAGTVLENLHQQWATLTAGENRDSEFAGMLHTSARKAVTAHGRIEQQEHDPCLMFGAIEWTPPVPGGEDVPAAQPWSVRAVIGTHLFDPNAGLDQTLANACLERMYPLLRYAHDAGTWLLRGPDRWDARGELAGWAVAELAEMMPYGDAGAEKGSQPQLQAERRKRLMTTAGANGVAAKMRAVCSSGYHPMSVGLDRLDADPEILWAGGVAWDLRNSADRLTAAPVPYETPHLHTAAFWPDDRPTPLWDAFVASVWPDPEIRAWALRVMAIAFTGYPDAAVPILLGPTRRGKSAIVALLMSVLGTYAHVADSRLLSGNDNGHASIVYALKGRRLSFIDEGPREGKWAQEQLKQITGGADLTGNRMRENPVTFAPTHTLVLTANDDPNLTDAAIRARTRLIPCEADPAVVRATRVAIGHLQGATWRAEAPGVLGQMIKEAARWLADIDSGTTAAAPMSIRYQAEDLAAEQDPVRQWVTSETEPWEPGTPAGQLYKAFVGWCRDNGLKTWPTAHKWGRSLNDLGYPSDHRRDGKYRLMRVTLLGGWSLPTQGNSQPGVEGWGDFQPPPTKRDPSVTLRDPSADETVTENHRSSDPTEQTSVTDVTLSSLIPPQSQQHQDHHIYEEKVGEKGHRVTSVTDPPSELPPVKPLTPKQIAKLEEKLTKIKEATGPLHDLPAVVDPDGTVRSLPLAEVLYVVSHWAGHALTVDVETTGYPIGHRDYRLKTIQLGIEGSPVVVLDAADADQRAVASVVLKAAPTLHAFSAHADLVPLAHAGVIEDLEEAWDRMQDVVIPAKLADPVSTHSDAEDLKGLSADLLGEASTSPAAAKARRDLFKAAGWMTDTEPTTPIEKSGWAQVDVRSETMIRYAASDVFDTARLPAALPPVEPSLMKRERLAQRMTARVADRGLRIDGDTVKGLLDKHRPLQGEAREAIRAYGIANPGSSKQVADKLTEMGLHLPYTKPSKTHPQGQPSVAEGVLETFRGVEGDVGALVAQVLTYREHSTAIGLFLEPYEALVLYGDGRARPTVYTLEAATGRMSCRRPNLQQVPRMGGFRACITADPGWLLISADFSGVEVRVMAALSGDPTLRQMIMDGIDLHTVITEQVFGPGWTKENRYMVKRGVFGWAYGGGVETLAAQTHVPVHIMAQVVGTLSGLAPRYVEWAQEIRDAVQAGRTQLQTHSGRTIHLPIRAPHAAPNYAIQGTARELLIDGLERWDTTRWGRATLLPVHDELMVMVPETDAEEATVTLAECMRSELYGIPVKADPSPPSFAWADAS